MGKKTTLGRAINERVRRARRAAREAVADAQRAGSEQQITVTGRTNIVARVNTGEDGAVSVATGQQDSPITQGSREDTPPGAPRSGT